MDLKSSFDIKTEGIVVELFNPDDFEQAYDGNVSKSIRLTDQPIPKKYCFPELTQYLVNISYLGYKDHRFARKNLIPHYVQVGKFISEWIPEIDKVILETQKQLSKTYSKKLIPFISTINLENATLWRTRVILTWKRSTLLKKFFLSKLYLATKCMSILKTLQKLLSHLSRHPRLIAFNKAKLFDLYRRSKDEPFPDLQNRIRIVKSYLHFIKDAWVLTKLPYSSTDQASSYLSILFERAYTSYIPAIGYLSECDEYYLFYSFLKCRISPIRYREQIPVDDVVSRIQWSFDMITSLTGKKSQQHSLVLFCFLSRFWFNEMEIFDKSLSKTPDDTQVSIFEEIRKSKIGTFKMDNVFSDPDLIVSEVFRSSFFGALREQLIMCWFQSTPIDAAFVAYTVYIQLQSFIKNSFSNTKNSVLQNLLRFLIISTDMPNPSKLFSTILYYGEMKLIGKSLIEPSKCIFDSINEVKKTK